VIDLHEKTDPDALLRLVHHHPGRIRARANVFLGSASDGVIASVRSAMDSVPGVIRVAHSRRTGSVLIEYEPGLAEPNAILSRTAEAAGLTGVIADAKDGDRRAELVGIILDTFKTLNSITRELTGGRADLRELVPAVLAATSIASFAIHTKDRLPRWDNALWWSHSIFLEWHRRQITQKASEAPRPVT